MGWGREQLPWEGTDKLGSRRSRGFWVERSGAGLEGGVQCGGSTGGAGEVRSTRQNSQILGPCGRLVRAGYLQVEVWAEWLVSAGGCCHGYF